MNHLRTSDCVCGGILDVGESGHSTGCWRMGSALRGSHDLCVVLSETSVRKESGCASSRCAVALCRILVSYMVIPVALATKIAISAKRMWIRSLLYLYLSYDSIWRGNYLIIHNTGILRLSLNSPSLCRPFLRDNLTSQ